MSAREVLIIVMQLADARLYNILHIHDKTLDRFYMGWGGIEFPSPSKFDTLQLISNHFHPCGDPEKQSQSN